MKVLSIERSKIAYYADFAIYLAVIMLLPVFFGNFAPAQVLTGICTGCAGWLDASCLYATAFFIAAGRHDLSMRSIHRWT